MSKWSGRFSQNLSVEFVKFTSSIKVDRKLLSIDILCNIAHCNSLFKSKILTISEKRNLVKILVSIYKEAIKGNISWSLNLEDIHLNVEKKVIEKSSRLGKKLRTSRSRNDLVNTELRIWVKSSIKKIFKDLKLLVISLIKKANSNIKNIMPSFTHFQIAQPISIAHYIMCYKEMFFRDLKRLNNSFIFADYMPLGSGAVAGTSFDINRKYLMKKLNFKKLTRNSIDGVSDRDYVIDLCYSCSMIILHISRICEEMIIFSSGMINFISIKDKYCSGSSMMPQKKNPDIFEVLRSKTGVIFSKLTSIFIIMKSLPLSYNKDYQEDKKICFEVVKETRESIKILKKIIKGIKFNINVLRNASELDFSQATDISEFLSKNGMEYKKAHELVSKLITKIVKKTGERKFKKETIRNFTKNKLIINFIKKLSLEDSVKNKSVIGGTAFKRIKKEIIRSLKDIKSIVLL
ncbi:argininosuccinate lyase [Candidatus Vidania fulgoroideorum]